MRWLFRPVFAFGAAWLVGRWAPLPGSTPPPPDVAPPPEEAAPPIDPLAAALVELRRERDRLLSELEPLEQQRLDVEGLPCTWPADLPERFGEEGVRSALREASAHGELIAIDCAEQPCLVAVAIGGDPAERGRSSEAIERLLDNSGYRVRNSGSVSRSDEQGDGLLLDFLFVGSPAREHRCPGKRESFRLKRFKPAVLVDVGLD